MILFIVTEYKFRHRATGITDHFFTMRSTVTGKKISFYEEFQVFLGELPSPLKMDCFHFEVVPEYTSNKRFLERVRIARPDAHTTREQINLFLLNGYREEQEVEILQSRIKQMETDAGETKLLLQMAVAVLTDNDISMRLEARNYIDKAIRAPGSMKALERFGVSKQKGSE